MDQCSRHDIPPALPAPSPTAGARSSHRPLKGLGFCSAHRQRARATECLTETPVAVPLGTLSNLHPAGISHAALTHHLASVAFLLARCATSAGATARCSGLSVISRGIWPSVGRSAPDVRRRHRPSGRRLVAMARSNRWFHPRSGLAPPSCRAPLGQATRHRQTWVPSVRTASTTFDPDRRGYICASRTSVDVAAAPIRARRSVMANRLALGPN